jgi:hypothetical protein
MIQKALTAVRYLLGLQYVLSGMNWWFKILPFPSLHDAMTSAQKHQIGAVMISTGWMFTATKLIELTTGLSLLLNRYVPLMLVVSMTVAVTTFLLDAIFPEVISGWFAGTVPTQELVANLIDAVYWGGAVFTMQVFLMLGYLHVYRPMLAARTPARFP